MAILAHGFSRCMDIRILSIFTIYMCRKLEENLNLLATKMRKPHLNYVDRLEIALGRLSLFVVVPRGSQSLCGFVGFKECCSLHVAFYFLG
jgi:hypothetical protein